jgi:hypothetical protein
LIQHQGDTPVLLRFGANGPAFKLPQRFWITPGSQPDILSRLAIAQRPTVTAA